MSLEAIVEKLEELIGTQTEGQGNKFSAIIIRTGTVLTGAASYTSGAVVAQGYGWLVGTCLANQDGTLYCQFSEDGSNWDGEHDSVTYTADDKLAFSFEIVAQYVRLKFTNGAVAQGTFRLNARMREVE